MIFFRKPVPTFRDHALAVIASASSPAARLSARSGADLGATATAAFSAAATARLAAANSEISGICSAAELAVCATAGFRAATRCRAGLATNGSAACSATITDVLTPAADFTIVEAGLAIADAGAIFATEAIEPPSVTASTPTIIRPADAHGGVVAAVVVTIGGIGGVTVVVRV